MKRTAKPRRGRPLKADKQNANLAIRLRIDERKQIVAAANALGMSLNRFVLDSTLGVIGMINGTTTEPEIVAVGRFLRQRKG